MDINVQFSTRTSYHIIIYLSYKYKLMYQYAHVFAILGKYGKKYNIFDDNNSIIYRIIVVSSIYSYVTNIIYIAKGMKTSFIHHLQIKFYLFKTFHLTFCLLSSQYSCIFHFSLILTTIYLSVKLFSPLSRIICQVSFGFLFFFLPLLSCIGWHE